MNSTPASAPTRLPAVLLAGPPNSGKSVLAYQLTHRLTEGRVPHYLLRAVPDGEGNWFYREPDLTLSLRSTYKAAYSPEFRQHMAAVIAARSLPLLVDLGGQPGPEDQTLLRACTHSILLVQEESQLPHWRAPLAGLEGLAELRSTQSEPEQLLQTGGLLRAVIAGLERDPQHRRSGPVLTALVDLLSGLFRVPGNGTEAVHLATAPYPLLNEQTLWHRLPQAERTLAPHWEPADLAQVVPACPPGPLALYGRGPVWLAAALAARSPAPTALFDVRFGWIRLDDLPTTLPDPTPLRKQESCPGPGCLRLDLEIEGGTLSLEQFGLPELAPNPHSGLILSGRLPRWVFAALARAFAPHWAWLGVWDPALDGAVVIHSQRAETPIGQLLLR